MKLRYLSVLTASLLSTQLVLAEDAQKAPSTPEEKLSYTIGHQVGSNIKKQDLKVMLNSVMQGMTDAYEGKTAALTEEQMQETITTFQKERMAKLESERKATADKNGAEGDKFLEENKKKEGVVTLASGLQYKIITEGTGKTPKLTDTVTTHYKGTLINGKEFDSSYTRGQPATFPVNGVIAGWTEALQLMKEGAKWQLFIPAKLAYGDRAMGEVIEPNSTLLFEIELLSVGEEKKEDAAAAKPEVELKVEEKSEGVKPQ
ncbi:FKBP-type peptidyl-prolyl cis-trans isomerase [Beggiatoa leptomitoformis]|uniref:Peptidyl-prolyl cis-trans isomerase n=1 Tax=Beggiatoa leptomitoformis TaxID=288004 RepID=A0A2N9YH23_9GAMM|nr:FKBP-type peptidyl-prolyl cis-trans isomerase [Beggiatoa leptomitoformis]ALG68181.1 FKBP-type peptidyl-prolyl cis-trans isomerase [Beggiatoa leptomitoformis]AUI69516.1 FKBP-type peptidyl-prolyl cis-trans isomerase [Beggiatoa leptomitoformis]